MAKTAAHVRANHSWLNTEGVKLSGNAFKLYFMMLAHTKANGECWPSQKRLGRMVGVTPRHIFTLTNELIEAELVTKAYLHGETCVYYVHQPSSNLRTTVLR